MSSDHEKVAELPEESTGAEVTSDEQPPESIPSLEEEGEKESLPAVDDEGSSLKSDGDQKGSVSERSENSNGALETNGASDNVEINENNNRVTGSNSNASSWGGTPNSGSALDGMMNGTEEGTENGTEEETEMGSSSFSSAEVHGSRRGRSSKKVDERPQSIPDGAHTVTLSVVIAKAIPTADAPDVPNFEDLLKKKKQRIVEAPKAQGYYHCQYYLLPDDSEPIRTDVVTFGMAAKIYTEHDSKVLKTWQEGDVTWIAWSHSHKLHVTKDLLLKLFNHTLELRVWESKDKVTPKARFDRPKAFRLPQAKPGEDAQDIGGVRSLVLKQSRSFEALQPKKSCLDRPVPTKGPSELGNMSQYQRRDESSKADLSKSTDHSTKTKHHPQHETEAKKGKAEIMSASSNQGLKAGPTTTPPRTKDGKQPKCAVPEKSVAEETDGKESPPRSGIRRMFKDSPMQREAKRKSIKAEQAAAAHAQHIKEFGNVCIPIRMKLLFADLKTVTNRLDVPVAGIRDVFITVSLDGPLMSPEQRQDLNPLVLKVASALDMPDTPLSYRELERRCTPVYTSYQFYKQPEYRSVSRDHSRNIYWDDINVELLGILPKSSFLEYLRGAPLEIQVHDRDRRPEDIKQKPTLFGEDTEDDKISNVGMIASKRTTHNPFKGRLKPWDPYGVAKIDLSGLLLGEKVIYQTAPIHNCPLPDLLGRDKKEKLIGVANAADGPKDEPLPVGHYIDSGARLKVRVEVAHPLTTPEEVKAKPEIDTPAECPFSRIIYIFDYKNTKFLHKLLHLVTSINARALELDHLPDHIIEAAISTYKLSMEQQKSSTLDIVTGFQILDGEKHIFVIEGLRDRAISFLWHSLPRPQKQDGIVYEALYNSDMMFSERKYAALDVDLCRIKLHEPLSVIVRQPLLYVRDMVPRLCFDALIKLDQLVSQDKLRSVTKNDLFPSADSIVFLSREFGVPLTTADFEDLKEREEEPVYLTEEALRSHSANQALPQLRPRRIWTPLELYNPEYIMYKEQVDLMGPMHDHVLENIENVRKISEENCAKKVKPKTIRMEPINGVAHNYSTQALNSTEQAKELLRQELAKEPDRRFTYCQEYNSASVVPVNVEAVKKAEEQRSKGMWQTEDGFVFPGIPSSIESNVNSRKPDPARRDELKEPWTENILHANILKPTLEYRDRLKWGLRDQDMNVWRRPLPGGFQPVPPITIHLAGDTLKAEKQACRDADQDVWRSKVKVYDTRMHFHRVLPETEMTDAGFHSSNQVDRLHGILKDEVQKLSLQQENLKDIPALSVVANPSVDTAARQAGLPIPEVHSDRASMLGEKTTFMPGDFQDSGLYMTKNRIPIKDMEHAKFRELKGYDFRRYHKERGPVYKRQIKQLSTDDRENHLFRSVPAAPYKEPNKLRPGNECHHKPPPAIRPAPIPTEFYYPDRENFLDMGRVKKSPVASKKKVLESAM